MFHKEGFKIILISALIVVGGILLIDNFITNYWIQKSLMILLLVFFILILQFFRDPKRKTVLDDNHIIAPADGKVVVIEEVVEKEYFKDKRRQISIFMSPLNVHVTRYPVSGVVKFSKYHPGKYLVAWHPKSSEENERTTIVVENKVSGEILYRQIAGAMARRIVNYAKKNKQVIQGEDAGFIKFGSRIDIFVPLDMKIEVKLDQKTRGGETILASNNG
ncbi:phosphatidylserine decarboxylase family protein [Lutimonas zeaxanthinifaciens]|uniref:phosphatidylserine decarboxylase family protein n=1 Tax=Lutimonas zeaxanthinifaciens TaxID=3060215 RepID=UPI00265D21FC|nr:phosphatidylserine decarboxylase family protein [Lutimonas sp. YSD2104]WKK64969.1 phosphatidylserine decarboxylase family protein [Lutimonas sp. YSD2104]